MVRWREAAVTLEEIKAAHLVFIETYFELVEIFYEVCCNQRDGTRARSTRAFVIIYKKPDSIGRAGALMPGEGKID